MPIPIGKLCQAKQRVVYSTYLGSRGDEDEGLGIAVKCSGNAYVAGWTLSTNFAVTVGAFQTTYGGVEDGFVAELNPTGSPGPSTRRGC